MSSIPRNQFQGIINLLSCQFKATDARVEIILQTKLKKCYNYVYYLTLQVYYFHHKNILKTRGICCLTHNFKLTVI